MKNLKHLLRGFTKPGNTERRIRRNENVQYCDNYTLLGSILGSYCGMLKNDG